MRSVNLLRIALEAELLRLRAFAKRQGIRVAFGIVAAIFAVSVLATAEILIWQVARLYVDGIVATLILLGLNIVVTAMFVILAMRNTPSYQETAAETVRRDALHAVRGTLLLTAAIPAGRSLWRLRRSRRR